MAGTVTHNVEIKATLKFLPNGPYLKINNLIFETEQKKMLEL